MEDLTRNQILEANGINMVVNREDSTRVFSKGKSELTHFNLSRPPSLSRMEEVFGTLLHREQW